MNNRLKELMLEAGYAAPELAGRANKLAELIVRECMDKIQEVRQIKAGHPTPDYEQGMNDGMFVAIRTIEEHFGVEE